MNPLANDRFAGQCGVELIEARPGYAVTRMLVEDRHRNAVDLVHGGALFTLAAAAFFAACNASEETGVGINLNITFIHPCKGGTLTAEATEVGRSGRLMHCEVCVRDEQGIVMARLTGTASMKR